MKTLTNLVLFSFLLTLVPLASAKQLPELQCLGTEPFWGLSIDAKGLLSMSDPLSVSKKLYSKTSLKNAHGTDGFAFQIEAQDQHKNTLKLNVVKTACNDGMSDNIYTYTALVDVDGGIFFGCCK